MLLYYELGNENFTHQQEIQIFIEELDKRIENFKGGNNPCLNTLPKQSSSFAITGNKRKSNSPSQKSQDFSLLNKRIDDLESIINKNLQKIQMVKIKKFILYLILNN